MTVEFVFFVPKRFETAEIGGPKNFEILRSARNRSRSFSYASISPPPRYSRAIVVALLEIFAFSRFWTAVRKQRKRNREKCPRADSYYTFGEIRKSVRKEMVEIPPDCFERAKWIRAWNRNRFSTIFERFTELWNLRVCLFSQLLFHKSFKIQFRVLKLSHGQKNLFFRIWLKHFENRESDVFTSLLLIISFLSLRVYGRNSKNC